MRGDIVLYISFSFSKRLYIHPLLQAMEGISGTVYILDA
ncbi:hypothetical protein Pogu_1393 [Pyrobaculum oguniense TE7]|uniref:Uncharacterized protein n=1 Tax=Pyrobaculum oguniense (strain DSM 13380 / JCM 10595 / TE7) TaxID=698757 RepID=H6Q939_PYROT|nr:hypothetical protein Pogu_1393 [Pyrobaculum oguniense TE7]